jgi:hypothetical protein
MTLNPIVKVLPSKGCKLLNGSIKGHHKIKHDVVDHLFISSATYDFVIYWE